MSTSPVPPPDRPGPGSGLNAPNGARSGSKAAVSADAPGTKSRRVRTGCLTCRERHLKCDEKLPICQNCCKSGRTCKRGLRLNFIDIQVKNPPMAPPSREWSGMPSPLLYSLHMSPPWIQCRSAAAPSCFPNVADHRS